MIIKFLSADTTQGGSTNYKSSGGNKNKSSTTPSKYTPQGISADLTSAEQIKIIEKLAESESANGESIPYQPIYKLAINEREQQKRATELSKIKNTSRLSSIGNQIFPAPPNENDIQGNDQSNDTEFDQPEPTPRDEQENYNTVNPEAARAAQLQKKKIADQQTRHQALSEGTNPVNRDNNLRIQATPDKDKKQDAVSNIENQLGETENQIRDLREQEKQASFFKRRRLKQQRKEMQRIRRQQMIQLTKEVIKKAVKMAIKRAIIWLIGSAVASCFSLTSIIIFLVVLSIIILLLIINEQIGGLF